LGGSHPLRQLRRATSPRSPVTKLTERERRLLALLSAGATNKEIAAKLHLSPDSFKKNASALYRKLGARNRTDAAQRAMEWLRTP
jgi:DNA-binding NarL/FixJ family response regulator